VNKSIFEKVKEVACIEEVVEHFGVRLDKHGKALCPFHQEKTPSFSIKKDENIFKCFGCGESGDVIDFVEKFKGVECIEAARLIAEMYGIEDSQKSLKQKAAPTSSKTGKTQVKANVGAKQDIKDYIEACISKVQKTEYFINRGLTKDTIMRFGLGYDAQKQSVVIPYLSEQAYYLTRSTDGKEFRKPPTEIAGAEPLWNADALSGGGTVFIVESPICAISIMQCGEVAVALCGTGINKLLAAVKAKKIKCSFVLSFDNDEPGEKKQQELARELEKLQIRYIAFNIADKYKDPNELLIANSDLLGKNLKLAKSKLLDKYRTTQDPISFAELSRKNLPPLKWAIKEMFPEGLHLLASMPKIGKSWMALNMCFAVANGEDYLGYKTTRMGTLYYALEDNYSSAQNRIKACTGDNACPENAYIVIDADQTDTGFFEKLEQILDEHPDIGFIVIDTLQNIRGAELKKGDVYGNDVGELKKIKKFARERQLSIVLVHHLRKAKDDSDPFNNILGSNGMWGTVDTGIILTKKEESDAETKMYIKGRGIRRAEHIITFDAKKFRWTVVGTPEEQDTKIKKAEYDDNPVIKTVKWLLSKPPYLWKGTATELRMASFDRDGVPQAITSESVGKTLKKHKMNLYYDGISVEDTRTSKKRLYTLYKKSMQYTQLSIGDKDEQ
jgi:hypothetical protein